MITDGRNGRHLAALSETGGETGPIPAARHLETRGLTAAVGIETGEIVVENLGSDSYISYTAIGETVNLASRVANWAKPGELTVGPEAAELAEAIGRIELV